jgi:hypothetical protein
MKQYTQQELDSLVREVELKFESELKKSENIQITAPIEASLIKAEEKVEEKKPEEKVEEKKPEEKVEAKEENKEEKKPEEKVEEKKPEEKVEEKKPVEAPISEDEHGYDDEDMQYLEKMYRSMSKSELKLHHDTIRKTLDGMGMEKCGEMSTMNKSEESSVVQANPELELAKSEILAIKAEKDELKKSMDAIQEFLTKLVKTVPQRKAITSLDSITPINKSEGMNEEVELTKSEITAILTKKASDPKLSKEDREAINGFYMSKPDINKIRHLLK